MTSFFTENTVLRCLNESLFFRDAEESDYVVTGGIDDAVKVWAWRNDQLELRHRLEGHALGVVSVDTSLDSKCKMMLLEEFQLSSTFQYRDSMFSHCIF